MRERVEQKLGFDRIRSMTESRCTTVIAASKIREELFSDNAGVVEHNLSLTDEMRQILMFEASYPDSGYADYFSLLLKKLELPASYLDVLSIRPSQGVAGASQAYCPFL